MFKKIVFLTGLCLCAFLDIYGQKAKNNAAAETAIRQILNQIETGWTSGDGKRFAAPFAEDADYVVINGMFLKGRAAIRQGHQQIFDTIYKNTKLQIEIRQIRFLRPDVAVVHASAKLVQKTEAFPAGAGAFPVFVLSKNGGRWQIVAFQNTANDESRQNGK